MTTRQARVADVCQLPPGSPSKYRETEGQAPGRAGRGALALASIKARRDSTDVVLHRERGMSTSEHDAAGNTNGGGVDPTATNSWFGTTLQPDLPPICFFAGTLIRTAEGQRPVEAL